MIMLLLSDPAGSRACGAGACLGAVGATTVPFIAYLDRVQLQSRYVQAAQKRDESTPFVVSVPDAGAAGLDGFGVV